MNRFTFVLVIFALIGSEPAVAAWTVYSSDFELPPGPEWSDPRTATTLGGRNFLGIFGQGGVTLSLGTLPTAVPIEVTLDLLVINTWDGSQLIDPLSEPEHQVGPDLWSVELLGGPTLFSSTFSVFDGTKAMHSFRSFPQSYPGNYPDSLFLARSGAVENDTLGYFEGDSVYSLTFDFLAPAGETVLDFNGLFPLVDPEEWGLDNVQVIAVPEPASLTLLLIGAAGLVCWRGRRLPPQTAPMPRYAPRSTTRIVRDSFCHGFGYHLGKSCAQSTQKGLRILVRLVFWLFALSAVIAIL